MTYEIMNNYGECDNIYCHKNMDELLSGFKFHKESSTIEINSIEELNLLSGIFGKILITKNKIIYYVD